VIDKLTDGRTDIGLWHIPRDQSSRGKTSHFAITGPTAECGKRANAHAAVHWLRRVLDDGEHGD